MKTIEGSARFRSMGVTHQGLTTLWEGGASSRTPLLPRRTRSDAKARSKAYRDFQAVQGTTMKARSKAHRFQGRAAARVRPDRGAGPGQIDLLDQVRRHGRHRHPAGRRPAPGRSGSARHDRSAERHRQEPEGGGLRARQQRDPCGSGGRGRGRRGRVDHQDSERLARLRRSGGDTRHDAAGRQTGDERLVPVCRTPSPAPSRPTSPRS